MPSVDITIHVKPRARKNSIQHEGGLVFTVHVTEPPLKGKANKAIFKLLSEALDLSSSSLQFIRGQTSTTKIVRIDGIDEKDVIEKAQSLLTR